MGLATPIRGLYFPPLPHVSGVYYYPAMRTGKHMFASGCVHLCVDL